MKLMETTKTSEMIINNVGRNLDRRMEFSIRVALSNFKTYYKV